MTAASEHESVHAHSEVFSVGFEALPHEHADALLPRGATPTAEAVLAGRWGVLLTALDPARFRAYLVRTCRHITTMQNNVNFLSQQQRD
jgi:hypothetical protein